MATQNKTVPTKVTIKSFLESEDFSDKEKADAKVLVKLFEKVTGKKCIMWGKIFGFGTYHYVGKSSEGEWMATGFALRKNAMTLYIMMGIQKHALLLEKLGKHKLSGGSCLYIKTLEDVDIDVLEKIIKAGYQDLEKKYKVH